MGIDAPSLALLSAAKSLGVDFSSTMMIGRQNFTGLGVGRALQALFSIHQIEDQAVEHLERNKFCEPLFELLGAKKVSSLDNSDYQQATHVHDLNMPIPEALRQGFTCVHEGGTIEHVFNCPQAFKNCLEMVAVGGHFVQVNEANNFSGHGFWQFSPELIYRILSPENGFRIKTVLMHERAPNGRWFVVPDPQVVGGRVELCNRLPTYILTIAERVSDAPILSTTPQQSDYVAAWSREETAAPAMHAASSGWMKAKRLVPVPVKRPVKAMVRAIGATAMFRRRFPYADEAFRKSIYRYVGEHDVMTGKNLQPAVRQY